MIMTEILLLDEILGGIELNMTSNYQKGSKKIVINFQSLTYVNIIPYIRHIYITLFPSRGTKLTNLKTLSNIFQYSNHHRLPILCLVMLLSRENPLIYLHQKYTY